MKEEEEMRYKKTGPKQCLIMKMTINHINKIEQALKPTPASETSIFTKAALENGDVCKDSPCAIVLVCFEVFIPSGLERLL